MNLASSFVNGFVNAAFGQDKLLTDDGNKWLYKNKDHGEASPALVAITMPWLWMGTSWFVSLQKGPVFWLQHSRVGREGRDYSDKLLILSVT